MTFEELCSFETLWNAYRRARRCKRSKGSTAAFEYSAIEELLILSKSLLQGKYQPDPLDAFLIYEPKKRLIQAPTFRDMESRMKDDQGVESVADLEKRYLTPNQEKTYDSLYGQVSSSSVWRSANQEQKDSIEEDIYNLAVGTDAGEKLMEKIEGGSSYGISEADYLLYLAAREIVDSKNDEPEKRNGSIDQEEAEAAIDMLTGLSDKARAYLWQSTNKGWKEEKNPYR